MLAGGHDDTITAYPAGTRSAVEAAAAIGCSVSQIAKSIVFNADGQAAIIVVSGALRVDVTKASHRLGRRLTTASAGFVRSTTGFAIGGVSPIAHANPCLIVLDQSLLTLGPIWAAAGSPRHVFATTAEWLSRLAGAAFADIAEVVSK